MSGRPLTRTVATDHIGDWKREDYRSFLELCDGACRLELPDSTSSGLLAPVLAPRPFRDMAGAQAALQRHPIGRYLKTRIPSAWAIWRSVTQGPLAPMGAHFRYLRLIVQYMALCWVCNSRGSGASSEEIEREKDVRALEHVARRLGSIATHLETVEQATMLEHLIATAQLNLGVDVETSDGEVMRGRRRSSGPKSTRLILRSLAEKLAQQFGPVKPALLREIAAATGLSLAPRDAQRYCADAQRRSPASVGR